jgi:hypothetical protein
MKNLVLYIFFSITFSCFSQNLQNANWLFGNKSGLTFMPNPNAPTALYNPVRFGESCATVSDINGNLLFYTDGITVWNSSHNALINGTGLLSNSSSTQGVIIVPRPNHDTYFVVTIDGESNNHYGLHYSEIDMSVGGGQVVAATKNTPLKDHNGIDIDAVYINRSEKLTSTVHGDGINYWIITQIGGYIYSYLVSENGISSTPVASPAPITIQNSLYNLVGIGHMKISPNAQRIGICYYKTGTGVNDLGGLALGKFNYYTGVATFDNNLITLTDEPYFSGLEFSPNSNIVYFSTTYKIYNTNQRAANSNSGNSLGNNLYALTDKNSTPTLIGQIPSQNNYNKSINPVYTTSNGAEGLQLAIDGKIYSTTLQEFTTLSEYLSVINDPDNFANPDFSAYSVYVGGDLDLCLPQWVHFNSGNSCLSNIILDTPETNPVYYYKYSDYIKTKTNYTSSVGQNITLQAGNYIFMEPGTHIKTNSTYWAKIKDCDNESYTDNYNENNDLQFKYYEENLKMYPNPLSGNVLNIVTDANATKSVTIYNILGKEVLSANTAETAINVAGLTSGVYIVKITEEGKTATRKLVIK